jgi:hypothetical protein
MSKKKLTLDKDRLVRLQDNQLDAATGGAEGNGSTTVTVTIGRAAVADASNDGSCCNKSCRTEAAEIA